MECSHFILYHVWFFLTAGITENGEVNSQATDSLPNGTPSSPESDGAKQAFVGIEEEDAKQAKSSVSEVLKKVRQGIGWLSFHVNILTIPIVVN